LPENATTLESDSSSSSSDEDDHAIQTAPARSHSPNRPPPQKKPPPAKPRKSFAERLAKSQRDESMLPRVTAYCTCEAYKLLATQKFLTEQHAVKGAMIYDEALYARYELPLLNGEGGFRVRSGELKQDDSPREYSSDSELQVKTNGLNRENDDNTVGSSAMLDAQMNDESLLFSPPKHAIDEMQQGVHFLNEEDQKAHQQQQPAMLAERPLKRRDSSPIEPNALSNLAERISFPNRVNISLSIFIWSGGVLEFYRTSRKRYFSGLDICK
jgi:uncharacterized Rmd1/YagE family protein